MPQAVKRGMRRPVLEQDRVKEVDAVDGNAHDYLRAVVRFVVRTHWTTG
jgi:hypothetical protein